MDPRSLTKYETHFTVLLKNLYLYIIYIVKYNNLINDIMIIYINICYELINNKKGDELWSLAIVKTFRCGFY